MNNSELYNDPQTANGAQNAAQPAPKKPSGNKGLNIFLCIVLCLVLAGGGAYWYLSHEMTDNTELVDYEDLDGCEDLEAYERFLELYPESSHATEVRERYEELKQMYDQWRDIVMSDRVRDYMLFAKNYPNSRLARECENKIDSLDWEEAKSKGNEEALEEYLRKHPDGRYASEASDSHKKLMDTAATTEEKLLIEETLRSFYRAYGDDDVDAIYTLITPVMTRFLQKDNATKADVSDIIDRTYNEHIISCRFVLNNDTRVKKVVGSGDEVSYKVNFTVDQHIERDNEGKTFGSYTAEATLTEQFKLSALTMKEISRR